MRVILKNGKVGTLQDHIHVLFDNGDGFTYLVPVEDIQEIKEDMPSKIINEDTIEKILNVVGIKINLKGYDCWVAAIKYYLEHNHNNFTITGELYEELAKQFNTGIIDIERPMRYAIDKCQNNIKKYFNINYRITNYGFLKIIAKEYLKIENIKKI